MTHCVFAYGTLRFPEVQQALYGRQVPMSSDVLPGFRIEWVLIADSDVVEKSGTDRHPILRKGGSDEVVEGVVLELTDDELAATDDYEVDDYMRLSVRLGSGVRAWAYLANDL